MSAEKRGTDRALFRRLLAEVWPNWLPVLGLFCVGLLAAPLTALAPLPLKIAVDSALGSHPLPRALTPPGVDPSREVALAVAVGLLIAVALLRQFQELAGNVLRAFVIEKQTLDRRARLFLHVQRLSFAHHDRRGTTDSMSRIEKDVRDTQSMFICSSLQMLHFRNSSIR